MAGKTPNFSLAAYKVLRTLYRYTSISGTVHIGPKEASMATLYELSNLSLIQMDSNEPRRVYITDYGRRVYFECDTPEGAKE
jgi:hypothetical protein